MNAMYHGSDFYFRVSGEIDKYHLGNLFIFTIQFIEEFSRCADLFGVAVPMVLFQQLCSMRGAFLPEDYLANSLSSVAKQKKLKKLARDQIFYVKATAHTRANNCQFVIENNRIAITGAHWHRCCFFHLFIQKCGHSAGDTIGHTLW